MGQIANQALMEMICKAKEKIKANRERKQAAKKKKKNP